MINNSCTYKNNCKKSMLAFRFLRVAKWAALLLLVSLGSAEMILHYLRGGAVNWIFCLLCAVGGVILFGIGKSLEIHECEIKQRMKRCRARS